MRNVRTYAQMGGAGSLRKVRGKQTGFPVMSHTFWEIISEGTTKSCQHLSVQGFTLYRKCSKWSTKPHLTAHKPCKSRGLRRSQAKPGTCDSLHIVCRCLRAHLWVGWRFWVQVLLLLAVVFFNSHSLNFQIKGFFPYCSMMKDRCKSEKVLSVKTLILEESKFDHPWFLCWFLVSSYSILTCCFLHHLCSSQFYNQSPGYSINMPLSKKKAKLSVSSAPRPRLSSSLTRTQERSSRGQGPQATWRWGSLNAEGQEAQELPQGPWWNAGFLVILRTHSATKMII